MWNQATRQVQMEPEFNQLHRCNPNPLGSVSPCRFGCEEISSLRKRSEEAGLSTVSEYPKNPSPGSIPPWCAQHLHRWVCTCRPICLRARILRVDALYGRPIFFFWPTLATVPLLRKLRTSCCARQPRFAAQEPPPLRRMVATRAVEAGRGLLSLVEGQEATWVSDGG